MTTAIPQYYSPSAALVDEYARVTGLTTMEAWRALNLSYHRHTTGETVDDDVIIDHRLPAKHLPKRAGEGGTDDTWLHADVLEEEPGHVKRNTGNADRREDG